MTLQSDPNTALRPQPPKRQVGTLFRDADNQWAGDIRPTPDAPYIPITLYAAGRMVGGLPAMFEVWSKSRQVGLLTLCASGKHYAGVINTAPGEAIKVVSFGGMEGASVPAHMLVIKRVLGVPVRPFVRR